MDVSTITAVVDVSTTTAVVVVSLSVLGGLTAGYAALRQRKTEDVTVVLKAMQDHMVTLQSDNIDLRTRMRDAEKTISDLRVGLQRCEDDKRSLESQMSDIRKTVNGEK